MGSNSIYLPIPIQYNRNIIYILIYINTLYIIYIYVPIELWKCHPMYFTHITPPPNFLKSPPTFLASITLCALFSFSSKPLSLICAVLTLLSVEPSTRTQWPYQEPHPSRWFLPSRNHQLSIAPQSWVEEGAGVSSLSKLECCLAWSPAGNHSCSASMIA